MFVEMLYFGNIICFVYHIYPNMLIEPTIKDFTSFSLISRKALTRITLNINHNISLANFLFFLQAMRINFPWLFHVLLQMILIDLKISRWIPRVLEISRNPQRFLKSSLEIPRDFLETPMKGKEQQKEIPMLNPLHSLQGDKKELGGTIFQKLYTFRQSSEPVRSRLEPFVCSHLGAEQSRTEPSEAAWSYPKSSGAIGAVQQDLHQ